MASLTETTTEASVYRNRYVSAYYRLDFVVAVFSLTSLYSTNTHTHTQILAASQDHAMRSSSIGNQTSAIRTNNQNKQQLLLYPNISTTSISSRRHNPGKSSTNPCPRHCCQSRQRLYASYAPSRHIAAVTVPPLSSDPFRVGIALRAHLTTDCGSLR